MSTESTAVKKNEQAVIAYMPLGGTEEVRMSIMTVQKWLCTPTKSGKYPTDSDCMKFMKLCQARQLDPWVQDAYLVGYDTKNGPEFTLITSHQALLKRAELCPAYQGMASGVIVQTGKVADSTIEYREGDLVLEGEVLIGGWARVIRSDRAQDSYDALNLNTFNTNRSRWLKDPAGMIVKCAEASALRKACPTQLSGMYIQTELANNVDTQPVNRPSSIELTSGVSKSDRVAAQLKPVSKQVPEPEEVQETESTFSDDHADDNREVAVTEETSTVAEDLRQRIGVANSKVVSQLMNEARTAQEGGRITDSELKHLETFAEFRLAELSENQ